MEILVSVSGTLEICFTGQPSLYAISTLGASLELPELLFGVGLFVGVRFGWVLHCCVGRGLEACAAQRLCPLPFPFKIRCT